MEEKSIVPEVIEDSPEQHQKKVDEVKTVLLESIRRKNPKLYWKLIHPEGYQPWERTDNVEAKLPGLKLNRNDKCTCGSGKKVKYCCGVRNYYTVPNTNNEENHEE